MCSFYIDEPFAPAWITQLRIVHTENVGVNTQVMRRIVYIINFQLPFTIAGGITGLQIKIPGR